MLFVALMLLAAAPDEGRGSSGTSPQEAVAARGSARIRAGVGGAAMFGLSNYAPNGGVGFGLDVGTIVDDRLALFLHAELGSVVATLIGAGALIVEYTLGEHFSAGLGVGVTAWAPLLGYGSGFYGLTFPLRINFAPFGREAHETGRRGLMFGLQVAPGFSLQPTNFPQLAAPLPPDPAFAATLSVGYAWW